MWKTPGLVSPTTVKPSFCMRRAAANWLVGFQQQNLPSISVFTPKACSCEQLFNTEQLQSKKPFGVLLLEFPNQP